MEYEGLLLIGILAFLLYHLIGSCNCNDGFSVGGKKCLELKRFGKTLFNEIEQCYSYKKCEFNRDFFGNTCDSFTDTAKCSDVSLSKVWTDSTLNPTQREVICKKYGDTNIGLNKCKAENGVAGPNDDKCVDATK